MTDQIEGQVPDNADGQVPDATTEPTTLDATALQAELAKARKDAASYRTKLRKLEEDEEARKREAMSELDRLKADYETLKQRMADAGASRKDALIRAAVTAAASKAGLADVEDAMRLGALDSVTREGDKVSGAEDVVAALVASKPYLVAGEGKRPAPSPTNPSSPSRLTIDAIKRMSVEEIRQNQDAVDAALANQS
jgi:hypothetical protein